ncbi:nucleotide-diphospho-sugar transferase [Pseudomonas kairouanensis]|uniref:Nucleotide-diphospho-sugar transferase n=1 Tax=Pseudomonas kairouanensis TaxID=2293832 RepID=A0A4Z0AV72_9PSED|nr:nucleotide-diphospho-sugar transferase [Pseudomonas kairouanensis]TFY90069.1 nucleotide-diphospho-sugar transferase [Pseudomonas kairouanensis]
MIDATDLHADTVLDTAVLFLVFNRIDSSKKVFAAIRQAKPARLYIAADGARAGRDAEAETVKALREYLVGAVDWPCQVKTLFREKNLGCKYAVSGAITWFFDQEEQGIILEDDCLPSQSFFGYCETLLEKYKEDETVFLVSGDGRATQNVKIDNDYSFVKYPFIWGWASWARVWKQYDPELSDWPVVKERVISGVSQLNATRKFWSLAFDKMYKKEIDTWDFQFVFLLLKNSAKCIVPRVNLITNIGFGEGATHTHDGNSNDANLPRFEITLPLSHDGHNKETARLNEYYDRVEFSQRSLLERVLNKIKRYFGFKL